MLSHTTVLYYISTQGLRHSPQLCLVRRASRQAEDDGWKISSLTTKAIKCVKGSNLCLVVVFKVLVSSSRATKRNPLTEALGFPTLLNFTLNNTESSPSLAPLAILFQGVELIVS
jgi:hypothetical protein